jgi:YbbR domain-containing protein
MKMRNKLRKHTLKIVAFLLSVFIWVYVLNSEKVMFEKTVELDYILPVDLIFMSRPPQEATFFVEGPRAFLRTISERNDRIIIDLNKENSKRQLNFSFDINPAQLELPMGMRVEKVFPKRINVTFEKKVSKIVPLKLAFQGQLPSRLSLVKAFLEPAEVEVYGPRSIVAKLKELPTRPVDLDSLEGQDQMSVEVQIPDERLSIVGGFDVKLYYQLKATTSNLTLNNLPIRFLNENRRISSSVKEAKVKVFVTDRITKNRSNVSSSAQVWADVPPKARGKVMVPLRVTLPPSLHLVEVTPKTIIVNVQ